MRNVIAFMCIAGFIAVTASIREEIFEDNAVDEVRNENEAEVPRLEDPLESGDEEDVDEEAAEYFFDKLFNRGKDAAGKGGNRTASGRGSGFYKRFFQKYNGTRSGAGGRRGGRRGGGGYLKKYLEGNTSNGNGSAAEGSARGGAFLKKLLG